MTLLSTRNLAKLPAPEVLLKRCRALVVIDATRRLGRPLFRFDAQWDKGVMAGFFDDERGCQISIHFAGSGTAIKGCAEDAFMSPLSEPPFEPEHRAGLIAYPGVLRNVPEDLLSVISSTNQLRSLTLCVWRAKNDGRWQIGEITWPTNIDDPDGSEDLFAIFAEEQDFSNWLTDLYQADFEPAALKHILENCPLTDSFLSSVGSKRSLSEIKARLLE